MKSFKGTDRRTYSVEEQRPRGPSGVADHEIDLSKLPPVAESPWLLCFYNELGEFMFREPRAVDARRLDDLPLRELREFVDAFLRAQSGA